MVDHQVPFVDDVDTRLVVAGDVVAELLVDLSDALAGVDKLSWDGVEIYRRSETTFLQLEIRRDHMNLDLWLPSEQLVKARESGIARAHPFMGDEAVKVRFERAEDLTRVARWLGQSYVFAAERAKPS